MEKYMEILDERFGKDSLMALATVDMEGVPWVRTINAVFHKGSFYTVRSAEIGFQVMLSVKTLGISRKKKTEKSQIC